jgi:hypothetical protein
MIFSHESEIGEGEMRIFFDKILDGDMVFLGKYCWDSRLCQCLLV